MKRRRLAVGKIEWKAYLIAIHGVNARVDASFWWYFTVRMKHTLSFAVDFAPAPVAVRLVAAHAPALRQT